MGSRFWGLGLGFRQRQKMTNHSGLFTPAVLLQLYFAPAMIIIITTIIITIILIIKIIIIM